VQIAHVEETHVCGNAVTGLKNDHIARHKLFGVETHFATVAADGRFGCDHLRECLDCFLGLGLLKVTNDGG